MTARSGAMWCVCALVVLSAGAGRALSDILPLVGELRSRLEAAAARLLELPLGYSLQDGEEFEYVVVGAGAAGSAAAARLARAGHSVLLMEAGGDPPPLSVVPGAAMALLGSSADWQYRTVPNNVSCLSSQGGQCRFSRGLAVGGSTVINYMMYVRGNRAEYELGLPGWSWADIEPYFLRAEGLRDLAALPASSAPYHNTTGPVRVGYCADPNNEWHSHIVAGLRSLAFPLNPDINAASQVGVTRVFTYTARGRRETAADAYLRLPGVQRSLRLAKGTRCTGVLLDDDNVAYGVTGVRAGSGRRVTVRATRGVVLSAGTLGTPQLLQLAGVGPAPHLRRLGIPVRVDLPVGDNMSDHVLPLIFIRADRFILNTALSLGASVLQYAATQGGALASIGLTDITAFANTSCYNAAARRLETGPGCELPTLQLINAYIDRGTVDVALPIIKQATLLNADILSQLAVENAAHALVVASPVVLTPQSRGSVRLASADPLAAPEIFPNYLGDARDVDEMLRAITILEHAVETAPYRELGASIVHLSLPGCSAYTADRDGYWRCYVRHMTFSVYHAAGTCALGSVLDERLRVRGVRALHVADLSALPRVPRGNTEAIALALGERLADFLLQDLPGADSTPALGAAPPPEDPQNTSEPAATAPIDKDTPDLGVRTFIESSLPLFT